MEFAEHVILASGLLLLVSILAGVVSSRIGAPLLLVFLVLGMLLGEDGPGGIEFDDFGGAYVVASLALSIILFDGGFRTPLGSVRAAWRPAALLATVGVLLTAGIAGGIAALVFGGGLLPALLVGAIIASTDAAAVFLLLHQNGMELRQRVGATLEVESGANDPMAVFLTVMLVEMITLGQTQDLTLVVAEGFVRQLGLGVLLGLAGGVGVGWAVNRLELAPGLYPVFVVAAALIIFGGTQVLDGSGFLAVYLAGIVAGNRRMRASKLVRRFHDGIAWISQIVMFLMLGLLVTPTNLLPDALAAGVVALGLIFVARPLAVLLCLAPFRFTWEERLFVAWVGLRGAVPIFLAIIPVVGGVPDGLRYFNVAFLVVLASLLLQGWTVPWVARRLGVEIPPQPEPSGKLDIDLPSQLDRDIIGYQVHADSPIAGRPVDKIALPPRSRILAVLRQNLVVPQDHLRELKPDDYVLMITPPEKIFLIDRQFVPPKKRAYRGDLLGDFSFAGDTPLARLVGEYELPLELAPDTEETVAAYLARHLDPDLSVGDSWRVGESELIVAEMADGAIVRVGLRLTARPPLRLPASLRLPSPARLPALTQRSTWRAAGERLRSLRRPGTNAATGWLRAALARLRQRP